MTLRLSPEASRPLPAASDVAPTYPKDCESSWPARCEHVEVMFLELHHHHPLDTRLPATARDRVARRGVTEEKVGKTCGFEGGIKKSITDRRLGRSRRETTYGRPRRFIPADGRG